MVTIGKLHQTPKAQKVIENAIEAAKNLNHNYVGTEHLLLGLIREKEELVSQILSNIGITTEKIEEEVLLLLGTDRFGNKIQETKKEETVSQHIWGFNLPNQFPFCWTNWYVQNSGDKVTFSGTAKSAESMVKQAKEEEKEKNAKLLEEVAATKEDKLIASFYLNAAKLIRESK